MCDMSNDQGGEVGARSALERYAYDSVCSATVAGWIYYCDEHDTHGNADTQDEADHMAAAHVGYHLGQAEEHGVVEPDPCELFVFPRIYHANDAGQARA